MNTTLFIARRYLFAKKKRNAINIISSIAVLAFAVCTAALIIILSTMNGFEQLIFSMYNRFNPDIKITPVQGKVFDPGTYQSKIKALKEVAYVWPVMEDNAAIRNGDYQTVCTVKGVDSDYFKINGLQALITEGEALLQMDQYNYCILGAGIDQKINCNIGGPFSVVSLITPKRGDYNANDVDAIQSMELEPAGVVTMDDVINNRYVFVPLRLAQSLFERSQQVSSLELRLKPDADADKMEETIRQMMGKGFKIQNRMEQQASLYKMFKSEKWASFAILTFILLIAAFNALGSLTMLVIEKKDDIRTLSAMGASKSKIRNIFFTNGFLISGFGALVGLLLGVALVMLQQEYGLVKMTGAIIDSYPVKLLWTDVLVVAGTALGLGFLTGIYPAMKSVKELGNRN
jgi:lipoprotein-releasing system permease protein